MAGNPIKKQARRPKATESVDSAHLFSLVGPGGVGDTEIAALWAARELSGGGDRMSLGPLLPVPMRLYLAEAESDGGSAPHPGARRYEWVGGSTSLLSASSALSAP